MIPVLELRAKRDIDPAFQISGADDVPLLVDRAGDRDAESADARATSR